MLDALLVAGFCKTVKMGAFLQILVLYYIWLENKSTEWDS